MRDLAYQDAIVEQDALAWLIALVEQQLNLEPRSSRQTCVPLWLHEVSARLPLTPLEEIELAALAVEAYDRRGTDELRDASEAIADWWLCRPAAWLRRRRAEQAEAAAQVERLVELMREADPDRLRVKAAA